MQVAASALESSLLKYSAKEYFFRAALCHLCVDSLNAQHAVQRYEEQYPAFADSREAKLVKVIHQTPFFSSGQVWSLSSFKVSCQLLKNDLNRVSSVSLLMTSSTALANEGLFELTRRPSLTRAVSSSFAETTEEPGCSQVKFA